MKSLRVTLTIVASCLCIIANANPEILKHFKEVYGKPNADCSVCHIKPPQRNPFGKSVEAAMDKASSSEVTAEIFKSIETEDSDGDGVSNGEEIKADTKPGDATSKPTGTIKVVPKSDEPSSELIPKHSLHPAIVHFPIALLAIAAFLEFLGKRKQDELYHKASVINLAIGLICATGAITTGIIAWLRLGYKLEGNLLIHVILASISVLIGLGAYIKRETPIYLWLILVSGALVLLAGHFGGTMIYG